MKRQFFYNFKGFNRVPSRCLVKIISDQDDHLICFEDTNEGTSVTNASEQLATEIVNQYKLNPNKCRFFETYSQYDYEDFDEIQYDWVKKIGMYANLQKDNAIEWEARHPRWKPAMNMKHIFIY